jgi:hypothetical protein
MLLVPIIILVVFAITLQASGEPEQSFVIIGADEVVESAVSMDPGLPPLLDGVTPRVVAQYANHMQRMELPVTLPNSFQALLAQISERVVVVYAHDTLRETLGPLPAGLLARLDQVTERIVFEHANANLKYSLSYPRELIGDTTPPEISEIGHSTIQANGIMTITWTTDEFADSTVLYGTQSGTYSYTVSSPRYVKVHAVGLAGLTAGETYYYKLRSTDLSENTTTTPEYILVPSLPLYQHYLPLTTRNGP